MNARRSQGLGPRYHQRRERAYQRVERMGLKRRWIAQRVGRSVRCVTEVLRGTDTGDPTLVRIELLLQGIERGDVEVPPDQVRGRLEEAVVEARVER